MLLRDNLFWVFRSLMAQKKRAMLTIGGLVIGVLSVAAMNTIGESLRQFIMDEFTQFGSNIVVVTPGKSETFGVGGMLNTVRPLTLNDAERLANLPGVNYAVPVIMGTAKVKAKSLGRHTEVAGVNYAAINAWKLSMASGQFLPNDDLDRPRSFVVLGAKLSAALFSNKQALGQFVHVGGQRFKVVGVLAPKGQFMGLDLDELAYIPAASAMQLFNRNSLMELDVFYEENVSVTFIQSQLKARLMALHGEEDFTLVTQDDMLSTLDNILKIVSFAAAGLGGISLLVGAVGIATIMLINVNERTREIGLMRAIGCSSKQIKRLFLFEAIILAVVSGLLGYVILIVIALVLYLSFPNIPIQIDIYVFFISLIIVSLIGFLAGVYPAKYAATLPPVDALRSE